MTPMETVVFQSKLQCFQCPIFLCFSDQVLELRLDKDQVSHTRSRLEVKCLSLLFSNIADKHFGTTDFAFPSKHMQQSVCMYLSRLTHCFSCEPRNVFVYQRPYMLQHSWTFFLDVILNFTLFLLNLPLVRPPTPR